MKDDRPVSPLPLTIIAAGALVWALIIVALGAIGPHGAVPKIFHSSRAEHFLAFYGLGVLATAAMPAVKLKSIFAGLAAIALLFLIVRFLFIFRTGDVVGDALAEIGGGAAALIPILVGLHRAAYRRWRAGAE